MRMKNRGSMEKVTVKHDRGDQPANFDEERGTYFMLYSDLFISYNKNNMLLLLFIQNALAIVTIIWNGFIHYDRMNWVHASLDWALSVLQSLPPSATMYSFAFTNKHSYTRHTRFVTSKVAAWPDRIVCSASHELALSHSRTHTHTVHKCDK